MITIISSSASNCIIENGIRFCERTDPSKLLGGVILGVIIAILWSVFPILYEGHVPYKYRSNKNVNSFLLFIWYFGIPLALGIYLITK